MIRAVDASRVAGKTYDILVVGTGFGSSFFLHKALAKRPRMRTLVLEWGRFNSHSWRIENGRYSDIDETSTYTTTTPWKSWRFTVGFGGGTNCWGAYAPRFHPSDFRLRTLYGVGADWPFDYAELEPFYTEAEALMHIAGDDAVSAVIPRSQPFPQRPHRMSTPDQVMKKAMPQWHFGAPSGRMLETGGARGRCCGAMRCELCPVDSKFTIENSMRELYCRENVDLVLGAQVVRLETKGGRISGLVFAMNGREFHARGDLYVLGANTFHNAFMLLKSGITNRFTGVGLAEKLGFSAEVFLRGTKNFDGGTRNVGANYALYDGPWRRNSGAALINFQNFWLHGVRLERGRWDEVLPLVVAIEDLPSDENRVTAGGALPSVAFHRFSDYAMRGVERAMTALPVLLGPLPVEDVKFRAFVNAHGHHLGTLRMGTSPDNSVLDSGQVHHRHRNLVVVGLATFPTSPPSNPSLTVAAAALRAAERLL